MDVSKLSDAELLDLYKKKSAPPPAAPSNLESMSDEELLNLHYSKKDPQRASMAQDASNIGEGALQAAGFATGVAEAFNPLNIPYGVESLGRGAYKAATEERKPGEGFFGKIGRSIEEGSKEAVSPNIRISDVASGTRAVARKGFDLVTGGDRDFQSLLEEERASQDLYNDRTGTAQTAGELGTAAASFVPLAVGAVKQLPQLGQKMMALKGLRELSVGENLSNLAGKSKEFAKTVQDFVSQIGDYRRAGKAASNLEEAKRLTKDLIGDVSPEVSEAIFKRSNRIEELLNAPEEARSVYPVVQKIRNHIDSTQEMIGEMLKNYRVVIGENKNLNVDTKGMIQSISREVNAGKLTTGEQTLKRADLQKISEYKELLMGRKARRDAPLEDSFASRVLRDRGEVSEDIARRGLSVRDLDKGEPYLRDEYWKEPLNLKKLSPSDLVKIIDKADSDLQPLYNSSISTPLQRKSLNIIKNIRDQADERLAEIYPSYKQLKTEYSQFKNKAELVRNRIDSPGAESFLSNIYGANKTEVRQSLEDLVAHSKKAAQSIANLSQEVKTGKSALSQEAVDAINLIRKKASESKFPEAKEFLNEIADIRAASALHKSAYSGVSDQQADTVARLIERYVKARENKGRFIGGIAGTVLGGGGAGVYGGLGGAFVGQQAGGIIGKIGAYKKAEQLYDPMRIFKLLRNGKDTPKSLKTISQDVLTVEKIMGREAATRFMDFVSPSMEDMSYLQKFLAGSAAVKLPTSLADTIDPLERGK